jgi:preprotein translocase subunit SecY
LHRQLCSYQLYSLLQTESGKGIAQVFGDHSNFWYMVVYSVMVIALHSYTALIFNPKQMGEDLKRNNGFIPGVKPGQPTLITLVLSWIRLLYRVLYFLALVGILPGFAQRLGVTSSSLHSLVVLHLLIMVGVILDTLQQIETQLMMRQYDGLMNSGRIQGRTNDTALV